MDSRVLVAYATRTGSTKEVATVIANILRDRGITVDLQPVNTVQSLQPYSAVVLGAALYIFRLHRDMRRFLSANRAALGKVPVALFVLGPTEKGEKQWAEAQSQLDKQLAKFPWFTPVATRIVGGRFDPAQLGFPFSWTMRRAPVSDALDWDAIRDLANDLAIRFQPALQASTR
jgi:menaquinone-dependent protoporphyrinogen oxidase